MARQRAGRWQMGLNGFEPLSPRAAQGFDRTAV
jgi:hypothetical protein